MFNDRGRSFLTIGGSCSAVLALIHVAVIAIGPRGYRYFGAPDEFAQQAAAGSIIPAMLTGGFALIFALWALYGLAGARLIRRPPFVRAGLVVIAAVYMLRGLSIVPETLVWARSDGELPTRFLFFSLASLVIGLCYTLGTRQAWRRLGHRAP